MIAYLKTNRTFIVAKRVTRGRLEKSNTSTRSQNMLFGYKMKRKQMRSPRNLILTVVIGVLFCTSTVIAKPTYWPFRSPLEYREKLAALKYYVRLHAKQKINTFYLAKLVADPNSQQKDQHLYAYWPEGKMIISVPILNQKKLQVEWGQEIKGLSI